MEGLAEEFLGEVEGGGAAVDEDGLAGGDQGASGFGDGAFGVVLVAHALVEGVGAVAGGLVADPDDAAVGALDEALLFERFQIAADRGGGDAELGGEGVEVGHAALRQELLEERMALGDDQESCELLVVSCELV